jgi:hypothetical protein
MRDFSKILSSLVKNIGDFLGEECERLLRKLSSLVKNTGDPQNITLKLQTAVTLAAQFWLI